MYNSSRHTLQDDAPSSADDESSEAITMVQMGSMRGQSSANFGSWAQSTELHLSHTKSEAGLLGVSCSGGC